LRVTDPAQVPDEPHPDLWYRHRSRLGPSLQALWARREIITTLAERDLRANYKDATLGFAWALLTPVATLLVMLLIFSRIKSFRLPGVPYDLYAYMGILPWQFFASSFNMGANSLLSNKALLSKVHFPRECFPLAQMLEAAVNTLFATIVLVVLFAISGFAPHVETLWIPLFIVVELLFVAGVVLAASALLVHVRDLVQVVPVVVQLGMFATPVIWPFSKIPATYQPLYSFFNPIGPMIDDFRRTVLLGKSPSWGLLGIAALGAAVYLVLGYLIFKRLEAEVADIA
jgi:ABC-2 type transport system permease protein/lipopolysaccharide transport system permease protein